MALLKKIYTEDDTGVYAEYWKISEINSNWITNNIEIIMVGYISAEARESGKKPLLSRITNASGELIKVVPSSSIEELVETEIVGAAIVVIAAPRLSEQGL